MSTTSTIGTASRNYSTIALWLAAFAAGGWIGECYNDTEFAPAGAISFSGHSTGAANFITLRCATGQSFRDNANVQTNALRYNLSNGVGVKGNFGGGAALFYINEDYVTIDGLQGWQSRAYAGGPVVQVDTTSATHSIVTGNILRCDGGDTLFIKSGILRNNLIMANPSGGGKRFIAGTYPGTVVFANNTLVSFSDAANPVATVFGFFGTPTCTFNNNALFGAGAMGTTTGITGNNTCSDLAIGFGSNNQASKTYANQFVNTTIASGDFKVKNSSADLYNNGMTDTTNVPAANDIALTSRPQSTTWDIGCWELVVGGGAQNITITLGTLKFAGFPIGTNAKTMTAINQGTVKFAGFPEGINGKSMFAITQGTLVFAGRALGIAAGSALTIVLAPLKFAGFVLGVDAKTMTTMQRGLLTFAGFALTVSGTVTLAIPQATLVFAGRALNFAGTLALRMLSLLGVGL